VGAVELPAVVVDLLDGGVVDFEEGDVAEEPGGVCAEVLLREFFAGELRFGGNSGLGEEGASAEAGDGCYRDCSA